MAKNQNQTTETQEVKKLTKKQLLTRLAIYIVLGVVIPVAFLIFRFNLFTPKETVTFGGWGLVGTIFVSIFFLKTLKTIRSGMTYSIWTQIIDAVSKVFIPLLIAILCILFASNMQKEIMQFLIVTILCETPAYIINPLPRWVSENNIEQGENVVKRVISALKEEK